MIYALIKNNICYGSTTKETEGLIEFDGIGKVWNGSSWDNAPIVAPAPIRVITKRSFMKKINQADRTLIRKSVNDIVIDIHEDLKIASSVDLDDQDTINAIAYLNTQSLLLNTNIDNLTIDGTEAERYP